MRNYSLPDIESAQDFSEIIEILRLNYRQWNQHLMRLMSDDAEASNTKVQTPMAKFINSCPWNMLLKVVCDMPGKDT